MMNIQVLKTFVLSLVLFLPLSVNADDDLFEESLEDILGLETELKADIGSRGGAKDVLRSRSPVDAITYQQIDRSGLTSLTDVLRYFVAGFNAPEATISDGTDHVRAFTLRGMSPDQVLVLVNGKRIHTSALLHVNGIIGRGASSVDLDTIAVKSIEKIEILRDGAAAQYGSDAISGVVNIILKGVGHKNSMTALVGQHEQGDGEQLYIDGFASIPLKYDGFINLSLSAKDQNETQRAGKDRRINPARVESHVGLPESTNYLATFNAEVPQENDLMFYSNATFNHRDSDASAFFRTADVTRPIFPEGFLPIINAKITDANFIIGANGQFGEGVFWDLSNASGYNEFEFSVHDSMNYTLGSASPTSFDNGELRSLQNTTNLDLKKTINQFDLAGGLEYRYESYKIESGDMASYTGTASQGFAGFKPENETDNSRNSYAYYADVTYHFNDDFSVEGAGRYEKFSDFGSTSNVKVAADYNVSQTVFLRTSASTGFRAPSLAQTSYSQTSSFFDGSSLVSQGTFTTDHAVSQILGAEDLEPETSKHFTIGGVYQPTKDISFMVDYFYTEVDDKIMLSNNLAGNTADQQAILAANGVAKARFFTNAANTETNGIDVKFNIKHAFENNSKLDVGFWYNYSKNEITEFNTPIINEGNSFEQVVRMEDGQPKSAIRLLTNYQIKQFDFTMNLSRYGSYKGSLGDVAYDFDALWTTDLNVNYKLSDGINMSLGGTNIFGKEPSKWKGVDGDIFGHNGVQPYSKYSPIGYSGAYYYLRTTIEF